MNTLTNFPTKHIEDNLTFGRDGSVWAYYEIEGFAYDFRDDEQKMSPYLNQMAFLTKNNYDLHFLLIPYQMDGSDIIDRTIQDVEQREFDLQQNGLDYLHHLKKAIARGDLSKNSNQYHGYIGVQLDARQNKFKEGNAGTQFLANLKMFLDGLNSPVRKAVGLEPYDILESELQAWKEQARVLQDDISATFSSPARSITTAEMLFITEYSFSVAMEQSKQKEIQLGVPVIGKDNNTEVKAVRPNRKAYYELQKAEVIPLDPKTLLLKQTDGEEEGEEYVRYLIIDSMDSENAHPGFEWLYRLQTELSFPVGVSIRACHKSNKAIRKELSNAKLSYNDQRGEAESSGQRMDKSVESSEAGAINMEEHFSKSGHPGYSCSFVLRLTGADPSELKMRVEQVRRELGKKGITLQSPYGDALKYFMEFIPGSSRESDDYWIEVSPGILASMMFGATTNIGDNRGFLLGFTKKLKKPVFIQPDLAAKNFDDVNNLFDSLAIMVAGETGKGKSLFMNLTVMLSALTLGSQVLIVDPKGDRKGWANGLPFIPKEHIEVWSFGENAEDAGSLDPFRTTMDIREAKDIAMDILSYLVGVDMEDDKYAILSEAVDVAGDSQDPCLEVVLKYLEEISENPRERYSEERKRNLEALTGTLRTMRKNQLAKLLFGKVGQNYRSLNTSKPIQVLMVQKLSLPSADVKKKLPVQKVSEAIMISLTAFAKQYMLNHDRSIHKIVLLDEARSIERSETGAELIEWIQRMGRYYNSSLIKGTQSATDYRNANHIGMKFTFQLYQAEEAATMLNYYNLPVTRNNIAMLQNLSRGECLFQDIYGRSAVISVNTIFIEILEAFRSDTGTDKERAFELTRVKTGG